MPGPAAPDSALLDLDPAGSRDRDLHDPLAAPAVGAAEVAAAPLEPVDVLLDRHLRPAQFLWQGGLWLVRTAQRQEPGTVLPVVHPGPALEAWRVTAGRGRSGPRGSHALVRDSSGGWWLRELAR